MVHKDGDLSERFFIQFCKSNNLKYKRTHTPFDFDVNDMFVEVKSTHLFVKNSNKSHSTSLCLGRYECWNSSQIDKMVKYNPWVCFIINVNGQYVIQGFLRGKNWKYNNKISISTLSKRRLLNVNQFLRLIRK